MDKWDVYWETNALVDLFNAALNAYMMTGCGAYLGDALYFIREYHADLLSISWVAFLANAPVLDADTLQVWYETQGVLVERKLREALGMK